MEIRKEIGVKCRADTNSQTLRVLALITWLDVSA